MKRVSRSLTDMKINDCQNPLILSVFSEGFIPQEKCIEGHEGAGDFFSAHTLRYICSHKLANTQGERWEYTGAWFLYKSYRWYFILLILLGATPILAQITAPEIPHFWLSGYICCDAYLDTRQGIGYRDLDEIAFPAPVRLDPYGNDINDQPSFYMHAIDTRLVLNCDAPGLGCFPLIKSVLSVDFRGVDEATVTACRMREAYFKLVSDQRTVLVGQAFHPLFDYDLYPNTVGYGKGTLVDCRAFMGQVQWTEFLGHSDDGEERDFLQCVILAQSRNSLNDGPIGLSSTYARNGIVPSLYMEFRKQLHFDDSQRAFVGLCLGAKRLLPRLSTPTTDQERTNQPSYREHAPFMMGSIAVYGRIDFDHMQWRGSFGYCQDGQDLGFFGGYAVKTYCKKTGQQTYTPLSAILGWFDFDAGRECRFSPGLFVSFTQNLGAGKPLYINPLTDEPIVYGESVRLRVLTRAAPRIWYYNGPLTVGAELEWTRANSGKLNRFGEVCCDTPANNLRILLAAFYNF